jgi:hypothetical protein
MENEVDVSRPLRVVPYEALVARRSLVLCIAGQHALQTDTHALYVMYRRPPLTVKQIETYNAIRVDVRMHRDRVRIVADEDDFGGFDGIALAEGEFQPIYLSLVQRIYNA